MNKSALFFALMSVLAGLNLGTVRHTEDPIRDTQTNPILYEQKKEEEKDGKKGPLLYHVQNSPRETFFIDPPIEKEKKSSPAGAVTEKTSTPIEAASWWEEQPTEARAVPSTEAVSEPLPESLPKEEIAREPDAVQPPAAAAPEAEKAASGKEGKDNDYWW